MPSPRRRRPLAALATLALAFTGLVVTASPAAADGPTNFTNTSVIQVPGQNPLDDNQPANPYPSTIPVSGMTGLVTAATLTLHNVTHSILNDMDVLLVAPNGSNLVVMSDIGGTAAMRTATNATFTFSDSGAPFPPVMAIPSGTYLPTNINIGEAQPDDFTVAGGPAASSHTTFADAFGGIDPNGTWSLYVIDDTDGDIGTIAGGWSLTLTTAETALPGALAFGQAEYRGTEDDGTIDVTVVRTAGSDGPVSAQASTSNGTAIAGIDYTAVVRTIEFADGQTSAVVSIPVLDDPVAGPDVNFTVTLSAPTGGATLGGQSTTRVVIENDDGSANMSGILVPSSGATTPYPSNIHLSGLGTYVTDVKVTLSGLTHSFSPDLDILLVSPGGQSVVLLSDAGGFDPVSSVTMTFDDAAAAPVTGPLTSGTFQPTDIDTDGSGDPMPDAPFPAPAPADPHGTALSVFNGTDPNGTWRLFVVDDATGDGGSIAGWSIDITTASVSAGGPYLIAEGGSLSLAATTDVTGATFAWDLDGDGSYDDATGSSPTVDAATLRALGLDDGPHSTTIGVRVSDGTATLTASAPLTITNVAPTATLTGSGPVLVGESASVTLSSLGDPSSADLTAGISYAIDMDGDFIPDATGTWTTGAADPVITVPAAVLATTGTHIVRATVADKDGAAVTMSTTIEVQATTPTATLTSSGPVAEGGTATVEFIAPVDSAPGATFTYSFDVDNDGVFDIVDSTDPAVNVPPALTADGPATHTVTGRISNQYGGYSDHTVDVVVTAAAPTVTVTAPTEAEQGTPVTVGVDIDDPSADDRAAGFDLTVDFGDGPASGFITPLLSTTVSAVAGNNTVSHTYTAPGTYTIEVTVADRDGAATVTSRTIVITAVDDDDDDGTDPDNGGTDPDNGGTNPNNGSTDPDARGTDPDARGTDPDAEGTDPGTGGSVDDDSNDSLPATGANPAPALFAGLLVLGAGLVLVLRRRSHVAR